MAINKMVLSNYGGASWAVNFEGDKDYVERSFNGLVSFGGLRVCSYFNFKYVVAAKNKLPGAFESEGRAIKMMEFWRGIQKAGRKVSSVKQVEEDKAFAEAEEFGRQYAQTALSQAEYTNFMDSIANNKADSLGEY